MKKQIPTALFAFLSTTIVLSHQARAASPTDYIKEVVADCENLDGDQISWKGAQNDSTCTAEAGIGFNNSKGLHLKPLRAGNIGVKPEAMIGHPPLDVSLADGYMFWVKANEGGTFFLEFRIDAPEKQRFFLGRGVLAMDTAGNLLDPKEYLFVPRDKGSAVGIKLPTDFEGWIIIPSTVSTDGQNTGWICANPETSGQPIPPIKGFIFVVDGKGDYYLDHFSLYKAKH